MKNNGKHDYQIIDSKWGHEATSKILQQQRKERKKIKVNFFSWLNRNKIKLNGKNNVYLKAKYHSPEIHEGWKIIKNEKKEKQFLESVTKKEIFTEIEFIDVNNFLEVILEIPKTDILEQAINIAEINFENYDNFKHSTNLYNQNSQNL